MCRHDTALQCENILFTRICITIRQLLYVPDFADNRFQVFRPFGDIVERVGDKQRLVVPELTESRNNLIPILKVRADQSCHKYTDVVSAMFNQTRVEL